MQNIMQNIFDVSSYTWYIKKMRVKYIKKIRNLYICLKIKLE